MCNRFYFFCLVALVLSGCGGKSKVVPPPPPPPPAATLTITVNPSSVEPGQSATLNWDAANATACTASGDWTGSPAMSGSMNVILPGSAGLTYTLSCTGAGGNVTKTAKLNAAEGPGGCTVSPLVRSGTYRRSLRHRASSPRTSGK